MIEVYRTSVIVQTAFKYFLLNTKNSEMQYQKKLHIIMHCSACVSYSKIAWGGIAPPLLKVGGQLPPLPPLILHHWIIQCTSCIGFLLPSSSTLNSCINQCCSEVVVFLLVQNFRGFLFREQEKKVTCISGKFRCKRSHNVIKSSPLYFDDSGFKLCLYLYM